MDLFVRLDCLDQPSWIFQFQLIHLSLAPQQPIHQLDVLVQHKLDIVVVANVITTATATNIVTAIDLIVITIVMSFILPSYLVAYIGYL